jgi:hypothetical protein
MYLFANPVQDAYNVSNVTYPYLEVLGGLENLYGMQLNVYSAD